jgi:uncharacterized protein YggE
LHPGSKPRPAAANRQNANAISAQSGRDATKRRKDADREKTMLIQNFTAAALAVAMLAAMAPAVLTAGPALAAERPLAEQPVPVIRVSGEGTAAVKPDLAIVTLGVLREATTVREALDAHNKVTAELGEAMRAFKIRAEDMQTANFQIQPKYVYPTPKETGEQDPPRIVGYTVSSQLVVRIRDMAAIGEILDKAVTLGVNSDGGILLTNDDPSAVIAKARAAAMKDAASRAKTLAEAAGVNLGQVLEISEGFERPMPVPMTRGKAMMDAAPASVPVETGENRYSVTVQAVFEIKG